MKKITLIFVGVIAITSFANAQTTIFLETFGTTKASRDGCTNVAVPGTAEAGNYDPQKNELFTDHDWSTDSHVWNSGVAYSQTSVATANVGACDDSGTTLNIRSNNVSNYIGASGNGNLYFNANVANSFTISGIDTYGYTSISLSFGIYGKNKADVTLLGLQCNTGSGYYDIGTSQISALSTSKGTWLTVSGITLPASSTLSLKFATPTTNSANSSAPIEIRIDDVKIIGTPSATATPSASNNPRKVVVTNGIITFNGFSNEMVEVFNSQGLKVFSSKVTESVQPNLPNGLYIVKATNFQQKIIL